MTRSGPLGCRQITFESAQVLTEAVKALRVTDYQRVTIDTEISTFHLNLAACERLYAQPIPIAYTRHTSRCAHWSNFHGTP